MLLPNATSPSAYYEQVARENAAEAARGDRAARVASWLRILAAAATIALLVRGGALRPLAAVTALGFVAAAWRHRRVVAQADAAARRAAAARAGIARGARRWASMPAFRPLAPDDGWPTVLARDLGVVGPQGLMRLLDVVHPPLGGRRLLDWVLGDPAPIATIGERQASVAHLRGEPALLVDVAADARHGGAPATVAGLAAVRAWTGGGDAARPRASSVERVVSVACVLALVIAAGVGGAETALGAAGPVLAVQLALAARARHGIQRTLKGVDFALPQIAGVVRVLTLLGGAADAPGTLGTVQRRVRDERAVASLARLARLLAWNETRHSPMAHWALNGAVGFDVHLAHALAGWHRTAGPRVGAWLDLAADAEALVALGTLAFEHPGWTIPDVRDGDAAPLEARALAHPLLAPDAAVPNDVAFAGPGETLVLSGSNMAGKTTFLRAVGLNVLLAQAGGPVSAAAMGVRRGRVRSSVRVEDDLGSGTSLFLAEATRLRDVIRDAEDAAPPPVWFLFDEILHGTNAPDRRVATRIVLRRLARAGACGLVTTHDPEVGDLAGTDARPPRHAHFAGDVRRDDAGRIVLAFDYRVRPGPAREANARAVLELLGIADA